MPKSPKPQPVFGARWSCDLLARCDQDGTRDSLQRLDLLTAVVGATPVVARRGRPRRAAPTPARHRVEGWGFGRPSRSAKTAPAGPISPPPGVSIRRRPATPELALGPGISRSGRFGVSPGFTGSRQVAANQTLMGPKAPMPGLPGRSPGSHNLLISGELYWSRRADSNRGPADYESTSQHVAA